MHLATKRRAWLRIQLTRAESIQHGAQRTTDETEGMALGVRDMEVQVGSAVEIECRKQRQIK